MTDPLETFLAASPRCDLPAMTSTLAPGARLISPLANRGVFTGPDLEILLDAVYHSLKGLTWDEHYRDGRTHVVVGHARVLGQRLTDTMLIETDADGRLLTLRPSLTPWAGLTAFALAIGPKLARHPDVLRRSLTAG